MNREMLLRQLYKFKIPKLDTEQKLYFVVSGKAGCP